MPQTKLSAQLGVLSRPDGSAIFCNDSTAVVAGIYGPVETKNSRVLPDRAAVEAHFRPKRDLPGVKDRVRESVVRGACEAVLAVALHPRASVVVVVQELQDGGLLLAGALNAACLAALDAGVDMRCMFAAVSCFLCGGALRLSAPLDRDEAAASFVFVFESGEKGVLATHTEGAFREEDYRDALSLCREQSDGVFEFFKRSLAIN